MSMGETAENVARKYQITREAQEEFAVASHRKAAAAPGRRQARRTRSCRSQAERPRGRGRRLHPPGHQPGGARRPEARLRRERHGDRRHLLAAHRRRRGRRWSAPRTTPRSTASKSLARIKSIAVAGCAGRRSWASARSRRAARRWSAPGSTIDDIDVVELNEAFASQALACIRDLGDRSRRRSTSTAARIALGHPLGATGARITGKAAALLKREGKRYALATQCIGGGQGIATVLEAV